MSFEAEDAVQETMTRAWRGYAGFGHRAGLRTWLHRIAANVCIDMIHARRRRALPMDLGGPGSADGPIGGQRSEDAWITPVPDGRVLPAEADPAELALARETLRLAFVAALLETSVASVNSALQRARATLDAREIGTDRADPEDDGMRDMLGRYLDAFERYDMDAPTALIHEDATQSMPPYELWLRGRDQILRRWVGPGAACRGSRLLPTRTNGRPAFGQYRRDPAGGWYPWSPQVPVIVDGRLEDIVFFLDAANLFPLFGLPLRLEAREA